MGASSSTENRRRNQQQQPQQQRTQTNVVHQQRTVTNAPGHTPNQQANRNYPAQNRTATVTAPPRTTTNAPARPPAAISETKTISNLCTVLPDTIKFDAEHGTLKFKTNSTVDCRLETNAAVRVDIRSGAALMTPNKPRPEGPSFSIAASMFKEHEFFIDLVGVSDQEKTFLTQYPKQIPLVITLRYTNPEVANKKGAGLYAGHQAEHTFVQIAPTCKMLRQLVEADGNCYNVEHLFGADDAVVDAAVVEGGSPGPETGSPKDMVQDDDDNNCVICLTSEKDTAVMPCRHLCLCRECAQELQRHQPKCPVCRGPIERLLAMKH